jgi:4-amino-4-deoxy-L-arabinose transferase-like glycosyltransferase
MKKSRRKNTTKPEIPAPPPPIVLPYLQRLGDLAASPAGTRRLAVGLALITFLLGVWTFDAKLSLSGDNTEFITLARSLAQGSGLTHINTAAPAPATKYPPGFPLLLAPMELLAPGSWTPMKWLVVVTFTAAVPLFFLLMRISLGTLPSLSAAAICLTLPLLQDYAHQIMSEIPYLAFSVGALYLLKRSGDNSSVRGNRWLLAAFVCTMAAYYIRTVGIVLVVAAVLSFLVRGERRKGLVFLGAALLAWLPWTLRNRFVGSGGVYLQQLIQINPYFPDQGLLDLGGFVDRVLQNTATYYLQILPSIGRYPDPFHGPVSPLHPLAAAIAISMIYAAVQVYRSRRDLLLFTYTVLFLGTVVLWYWSGDRFLVPILPMLIYFAVIAASDLLNFAASRGLAKTIPRLAAVVLVVAVLSSNAIGMQKLAARARGDYYPNWENYYRAGLWLRENTPATSVVACRKGYWMYVVSGRPCALYAFDDPETVVAGLEQNGVDFVVVEQLGFRHTGDYLVPAIQKYKERFEVVWHAANPDTWVLKFVTPN